MRKTKIVIALALFITVAFLFGCKKLELDKIAGGSWNPNFAVPVAFGEFDVYDILARVDSNEVVVIDPVIGNISLMYSGDLFEFSASDLFTLEDFSVGETFSAGDLNLATSPSFSGSVSANTQTSLNIPTSNNVEIHQVQFTSGGLTIEVATNIRHQVNAVISLPDFIKNGNPVQRSISINGAGTTGTVTSQENINLTNATLDMGSAGNNEFNVQVEATVTGSGAPISGNEFLQITIIANNMNFASVVGYFGQTSLNIQDSILLRIFDNVNQGVFQFNDPKFRLDISNSFGVPAQIDINELKTIVVQTGAELLLTGYPNNIAINSPSVQGEVANTIVQFDNTNTSNIETIVSPTPRYLYYDGAIQINPMGPSGPLNFILNSSTLSAKGEVELPLDGFAYGFEVRDTVPFSTGTDFSQTEAITFVMFRLITNNGFPVDVQTQIRFMDENFNTIFTAFDTPEDVILSGVLNSDGRVIDFTEKTTDIILTQEQIALLPNVEHIELVAFGETKNGPNEERVVFFDDYKLKMKLGLQVEGSQNF
jgi:hypothetical protein